MTLTHNEYENFNLPVCIIQNEYVCEDENTPETSYSNDYGYCEITVEDNFDIESEEKVSKMGQLYEPPQKK